ncbi:hypothetical protein N0V90_004533 [Kalmusia sp. IMI 367209]|nr:hypothetical protein N0V90_004533 [Kalmusia sp. IMI 367209]
MTMASDDLRDSITKELGDFVESKSSAFACPDLTPISLRWDSSNSPSGVAKLTFPLDSSAVNQKSSLAKLISDCQPASFGYKGEDVLDESYRKATKMDRAAFSIDFCPYELGMIDTIAQVLLPNASGTVSTKGVRAELYKLNVNPHTAAIKKSTPRHSGFFKAHVDTPRSDTQFGSLEVSLPCHHEGGELIVRHADQSVTFNWGASNAGEKNQSAIQWAAFYSDCEHEVKEVTEGYRVTLTYNLYYALGVGELAGNSLVIDVTSLPLFQKIKQALYEPTFMAHGGTLGVFCQHAYAHSTPEGIEALPGVLKGSDMAVYSVFLALGLNVCIRPVLDLFPSEFFREWEWAKSYEQDECADKDFIGLGLKELQVSEIGILEEPPENILGYWGGDWLKVNWLTQPTKKNINFVHLTYGNQPGINYVYTHAALIIFIPPASLRGKAVTEKASYL